MACSSAARSILRIGLDFDNTIAGYDELIHRVALEQDLIDTDVPPNKRAVRDQIRMRPKGEIEWQVLQGIVYGPRMGEARLFNGVQDFLRQCRQARAATFIVSHKTEFANFDPTQTPLREAALSWLDTHGLFSGDAPLLSRSAVFFEATRPEKLARIEQLGCTHFVDDLEEVFSETGFPEKTTKILFAPRHPTSRPGSTHLASTWAEVTGIVFAKST